ncbi:hypothetical protein ABIF62_003087 [Bradyrhizobium japonicum]
MNFETDEDLYAGFDVVLKPRGRGRWKWAVCTAGSEVVMAGSECSRAAARYKAERALFLLLCASASRALSPVKDTATARGRRDSKR